MGVHPNGRLADTDGRYSPALEGRIVMRNDDDRYRNGIGSGLGGAPEHRYRGSVSVAGNAYGDVGQTPANVTQG